MVKRERFIDIARAFAMIFIVLGHTIVHSSNSFWLFKLLYSFHVVLFFVLSGFTFSIKKNSTFLPFIKKRFINIMIPYFVWAFLYLIPYMMFGSDIGDNLNVSANFDLKNLIFNILYGIGNNSALKQNSSLWFLPALFSMEILYYFVISFLVKNEKKSKYILVFIISIFFLILFSKINFYLPWGGNTALTLGIFYYIGWLLKNKINILDLNFGYYALFFILGIIFCFLNIAVSCIDYNYGNIIFAFFSGVFLSLFVLKISKIIGENLILEYVGRNTLGILIFHKIIVLIFQTKFGVVSKYLLNSNFIIELLISIFVSTLSIIFSLVISLIILKFFPILLGKFNKKVTI